MKKILVIEDTLEVRENLCEILELANYKVVSAKNGILGLEKAKEEQPDLILCDVMMPELDGFGVLKILNKSPDLNHIPLIFLTAKAEKSDMRKGMGLGAEDYITKPFDDVELLDAIEIRLQKAERLQSAFDKTEIGLQSFFSEAKANEDLQKLSMDKERRNYEKKAIVYSEGQNPRWLYFIVEGSVKVYKTNEYGKELTTELFSEGDFFGYDGLITDEVYGHTASCTTDVVLRRIPKEDFFLLLYNNRDFGAQFIKMLAQKNKEKESQLIDIAYNSVRKKVANALCTFATKTTQNKELSNFQIRVSREDLASIAGTAKETLIRTLSDFKNEGLIEIKSQVINIPDINALNDLIG